MLVDVPVYISMDIRLLADDPMVQIRRVYELNINNHYVNAKPDVKRIRSSYFNENGTDYIIVKIPTAIDITEQDVIHEAVSIHVSVEAHDIPDCVYRRTHSELPPMGKQLVPVPDVDPDGIRIWVAQFDNVLTPFKGTTR